MNIREVVAKAIALLLGLFLVLTVAQAAETNVGPMSWQQVELQEGKSQNMCKAYEGFINYAESILDGDYDTMMREPGFEVFTAPTWQRFEFASEDVWDAAKSLIDEYYWEHDVNLARLIPFDKDDAYSWEPTPEKVAEAREIYMRARKYSYNVFTLARTLVDINNDGNNDYVWRSDNPRKGSLVVTNEAGDKIEEKLTRLLRRHRGREEMGLGYYWKLLPHERERVPIDRERELGITKGGHAYHHAFYHVFGFEQQTYFSLQWTHTPGVKMVAGEQYNRVTVFKATGDQVVTVCVMEFLPGRE